MSKISELIELAKNTKWSCELCGYDKKVVNHHISYIPERILVVCPSCHTKLHGNYYGGNPELCPKEKRSDWIIVKRLIYPSKLDEEKLDGNWKYIKTRLDRHKINKLLKKEGKSPSDEEMLLISREKGIL